MPVKCTTAVICLSPYYGGMELDAISFAKLLAGSTKVFLIAKHGALIDTNYRSQAASDGVEFRTIDFRNYFSLSIIAGVRKLIDEYQIRNVIFFGASEMRSLYFAFHKRDINLIIRHGTTKSRPKKDFLHRLVYSQVNWHIPICKHIADNVKYIIPFGKTTRMQVVYPSLRHLPDNLPQPHTHAKPEMTLLHVARITEGKGHIDAIKACRVLHEQRIAFRLICVGEVDPNFQEKLDAALQDLPYRQQIEFPGFCADVASYYQNSDIFIFPSRGEGLSNSFIEALAYGLVCIAYANTSFPELKQAGFEFFMPNDGDLEELTSSVLEAVNFIKTEDTPLLSNSELAKRMFSIDREREELLQLLV